MAAKLDLYSPWRFNVTREQTNLNKVWEHYMKRFEYYVKAANITKDDQKRALLLHVARHEVQDIFETLDDQGTTYDDTVKHLTNYFKPKEKYCF